MSDEVGLVYTGSRVESLFLEEMLEKNGIGVMRRDSLSESVNAGWVDGSPEDSVRLFVESTNLQKAKEILNDYFNSRNHKK